MPHPNKQHPYESIDTAFAISDALIERGVASHLITTHELAIMGAVSCLLSEQDHFHPNDIVDLIEVRPGNARSIVHKFEARYSLLEGYRDLDKARCVGQSYRGRHRRFYTATEFGRAIFGLFRAESSLESS
jgi:hypothetical protein